MPANRGHGETEDVTVDTRVVPMLCADGWADEQQIREYWVRSKAIQAPGGAQRTLGDGYVDITLEATPGTPTAVVEAKRHYRTADDAIQQAIRYAEQLDVPLAYGCNGDTIIQRNLRTGTEQQVQHFASPEQAWAEYCAMHGLTHDAAKLIAESFNRSRRDASSTIIQPRYYQMIAINRVLAAIAKGKQRILLLMATGTGKTFTAMQIVAKLRAYHQAVNPNRNFRVLYLADRDELLKNPMKKDFIPAFGAETVQRVKNGSDTSREIYFASYQALSGDSVDENTGELDVLYRKFRRDFFDLVIVDECHRGSAKEDSAWRNVLDHFTGAIQLGLTATPLEQNNDVVSYEYFGNPVFKYSLRQGIEDGYLAPYRVRRVVLTPDAYGWSPGPGETDLRGRVIPTGQYSTRDFERVVSLLQRTKAAAHHLSKFLRKDPTARAVIFCVDTEHANDMRRALIEENPDFVAADPQWVVRIVGVEGERERLLEEFTDPTTSSPVVATTSKLLSTGIDIEDLKFVVIFRPVGSMIEFKQIIGRGTRLYPPKDKTSFDIIDYVGATNHFQDPAFDGYPADIVIDTVDPDGNTTFSHTEGEDPSVNEPEPPFTPGNPPTPPVPPPPPGPPPTPRQKFYVDSGDFGVEHEARFVAGPGRGGITLTEYGAFVSAQIHAVGDADDIALQWSSTGTRQELLYKLAASNIDITEIVNAVAEEYGTTDIDPLDALFSMAWNQRPRTRAERVRKAREQHSSEMEAMSDDAREILNGLLDRYEAHGVTDLESNAVYRREPLSKLGTLSELADRAGGAEALRENLELVQQWLFGPAS